MNNKLLCSGMKHQPSIFIDSVGEEFRLASAGMTYLFSMLHEVLGLSWEYLNDWRVESTGSFFTRKNGALVGTVD